MSEAKGSRKANSSNLNQFNKYLDNNIDVLHQKFDEYYGDPFPFEEVTGPEDLQFSIKYIYDVFNFGKYEANPTLNKTLKSSLITNIKSFVQTFASQYQTFNQEVAVKLLKYCIQNNQMFAVHYDKKKPQKKVEDEEKQEKSEAPEPPKNAAKAPVQNQEPKVPKQQSKQEVKQQLSKTPKQEPKQTKIQPISNPTPVHQSRIPRPPRKSQQIPQHDSPEEPNKNEFLNQQIERAENTQLIKKQLKGVFQFYCKQQQNISPHSTFDNINHKCQTMNLGKFMAFAIASDLVHTKEKSYSEGKLDKRIIVATYKKVAEGEKEIGFIHFLNLMQQLKKLDHDIYIKLGVGIQGPKGKSKLLQKLKYFSLPFNTRDPQGRQIMPYNRVFVPKLTTHSGKHQPDLRDQLLSRKQRAKHQSSEQSRLVVASKMGVSEEQTKFNLKQTGSQQNRQSPADISFLSRLIKQDDNDEVFLKEYQLPSTRISNLQNLNKSVEKGRYDQGKTGAPFTSKSGALTSRKNKKEEFTLPAISRRAAESQTQTRRQPLGMAKRFGDRSVLN